MSSQSQNEAFMGAVRAHADDVAQQGGYDNALTLASYCNSRVRKWASEAQAFVYWRDDLFTGAFAELAKSDTPDAESFIASVPKLNW